jgi:hypothetical protein
MPKKKSKKKRKREFSFKIGSASLSDRVIICFFPELPNQHQQRVSSLTPVASQGPAATVWQRLRPTNPRVGSRHRNYPIFFFVVYRKVKPADGTAERRLSSLGGGWTGAGREVTRGGGGLVGRWVRQDPTTQRFHWWMFLSTYYFSPRQHSLSSNTPVSRSHARSNRSESQNDIL